MKLSISNIAWTAQEDPIIYEAMQNLGFEGLEIAPTRIFPEAPYEHLKEAASYADRLLQTYQLSICSMQSIWYGRTEKLFGTPLERQGLLDYTKKAIDFAAAVRCPNLVFGSPRNRQQPEDADAALVTAVLDFFRELKEYALSRETTLSMEANPPLYNTNFINTTAQACELIQKVHGGNIPGTVLSSEGPKGFGVNLDLGTVIENQESLADFPLWLPFVNHIHISEPGLPALKEEHISLYKQLLELVQSSWKDGSYSGFVSIEMGRRESAAEVLDCMNLIHSLLSSFS